MLSARLIEAVRMLTVSRHAGEKVGSAAFTASVVLKPPSRMLAQVVNKTLKAQTTLFLNQVLVLLWESWGQIS